MFYFTCHPCRLKRSQKRWLLLFIVFGLVMWQGAHWSRRAAFDELQRQGRVELARYVEHLQGQLEKYGFLPVVLARDKRLMALLQQPGDRTRIKEEGHGLGLGLSISQRIVEVMGGKLKAGNHSHGGAEFSLYLRLSEDGRLM